MKEFFKLLIFMQTFVNMLNSRLGPGLALKMIDQVPDLRF